MPTKIARHTVTVHRDGKSVRAPIGKPFDFTDEEVKQVDEANPRALRVPHNEFQEGASGEGHPPGATIPTTDPATITEDTAGTMSPIVPDTAKTANPANPMGTAQAISPVRVPSTRGRNPTTPVAEDDDAL